MGSHLKKDLFEWLAHCEAIHPAMGSSGLDAVRNIKDALGIEFSAVVVVVAGTNGKGSSCALLESIAIAAGYKVGVYSKPHLVHFNERYRVNGRSVGDGELVPHFEAVEVARGEVGLTYFEFTTLAIARHLSKLDLDLVILEVGLGGRLDAVNAFDAGCSLITAIDLDHVGILGNDRESIGYEKAGVMRSGCITVVSDVNPPQSILDYAERIGSSLKLVRRNFDHVAESSAWHWTGESVQYNALPIPSLAGDMQIQNASGVLAVFESLKSVVPVSSQSVVKGLRDVCLKGRLQTAAENPKIVVDVAHNPQAVANLFGYISKIGSFEKVDAVFGCMSDKDAAQILTIADRFVDRWHVCDLNSKRAMSAQDIESLLGVVSSRKSGEVSIHSYASPTDALLGAKAMVGVRGIVLVFGSFITAGECLSVLDG